MIIQGLQGKGSRVPVESHQTPQVIQQSHNPDIYHRLRVHTNSKRRRAVSTVRDGVSTVKSTSSPRATRDKVKAIMTEYEPEQTTTKLRERQERAGYEAAIRLQEQMDEEENQRIARDAKIAQRLQEDIKAVERQRMAQKLQAEEKEKYSEDGRTKMLVDLINQRKKFFAQQRAKAKRNKPMT
nr:hypothetical protein [Tanacetum cinerariifolium]